MSDSTALSDGLYAVEAIVGKRFSNDRIEYRIKWLGYSDSKNTWEPVDNILEGCHHLIKCFEDKLIADQEVEDEYESDLTEMDDMDDMDDGTDTDSEMNEMPVLLDNMSFNENSDPKPETEQKQRESESDVNSMSETTEPSMPVLELMTSETSKDDSGLGSDISDPKISAEEKAIIAIKSIDVSTEWPEDWIPKAIQRACPGEDMRPKFFQMTWYNKSESSVVLAKDVYKRYPQIAIKFFESISQWH